MKRIQRWAGVFALLAGVPGFAQERFERDGVTADRAGREVRVEAAATGLVKGVQAEFILIGPKSGHAYEAIAVARAAPGDIRAALEFAGFKAGHPIDPAGTRFWSRGDRVEVSIEWRADAAAKTVRRIRAEETILDRRTGRTLPPEGFVFAGSTRVPDGEHAGALMADVEDPMSVISGFNHPATLFDIPRQGTQDELYDHQFVNPDFLWAEKTALTFVFRPARPEGPPFELDAQLRFTRGPDGAPVCEIAADGAPAGTAAGTDAIAAKLRERAEGGRVVFATVAFADDLPLRALREAAAQVRQLTEARLVRIEPPSAGDLYFQAFQPNEVFRERVRRPAQPLELRLWVTGGSGAIAGTLVRVTQKPDTDPPEFDEERIEAPTPEALRAVLDRQDATLPVLLVYAPAHLVYRDLRDFVRPALKTHPVVYFFEE